MTCKCAEEDNVWNLAEGEEVPAVCTNYMYAYDGGICWFCGHVQSCHPRPIRVWCFVDAPKEYRELSERGGDEDWVAFVPDSVDVTYCLWLSEGLFGDDVDVYQVDGGVVHISAHA